MKVYPCAKINLGLYVTERRPDGYHNLETVFYPIPLCDVLEVETSDADQLLLEGIKVDGPTEQNLVMRVVALLRNEGRQIPPLCIRLRKNIPSGAGLGGGSSDAAAMMKLLNEMFHLGMTETDMEQRVAKLGADCPFFIRCQPVFATGIGDQFTPISLNLQGLYFLLVKPDDFVSTREAYANIKPQLPQHSLLQSIQHPIAEWQSLINNDFEKSVFPQHPTIAAIKENLYKQGAVYAAMSGSGSSVFGLFSKKTTDSMLANYQQHFTFSATL